MILRGFVLWSDVKLFGNIYRGTMTHDTVQGFSTHDFGGNIKDLKRWPNIFRRCSKYMLQGFSSHFSGQSSCLVFVSSYENQVKPSKTKKLSILIGWTKKTQQRYVSWFCLVWPIKMLYLWVFCIFSWFYWPGLHECTMYTWWRKNEKVPVRLFWRWKRRIRGGMKTEKAVKDREGGCDVWDRTKWPFPPIFPHLD